MSPLIIDNNPFAAIFFPITSSSNGTFSSYKSKVKGDVVCANPIVFTRTLPIKNKNGCYIWYCYLIVFLKCKGWVDLKLGCGLNNSLYVYLSLRVCLDTAYFAEN